MSAEADDMGRRPPADERVRATLSRRPRGPRRDDDGREQVVLREVEPGGDEQPWPRPPAAASVAVSLIEAFQSPAYTDAPTIEPVTEPDDRPADTTDHHTTTEPDGRPADTTDDGHGRGDGIGAEAALAVADGAADTAEARHAREAEPAEHSVRADGTGPITDRFANIPTVPMEPPSAPELPADGTPVPVEAVGDTEVPPAPVRAGVDAPVDGTTSAGASTTGPPSALGQAGDRAAAHPGTAHQRDAATPAWRAALSEAGTWTTVAQFTLLFIGMLCVFQIVVLLVVNQFLSRTQGQGVVAADMLAAHAKVATVMLPALVGGAFAAAAFAAWRAYADPREPDDTSRLRRRVLGLPVAIWAVFAAGIALLIVVLFGTSATVAEAQRMTWWAIGTCTLLGVACIAAPRGLTTRDEDDDEAGPTAPDSTGR